MPKKETGMPFEVHPSPMKNAEGRNLLYAIPMQRLSTTLDELDDFYLDQLCEGPRPQLKRIRMGHAFIYTEVK